MQYQFEIYEAMSGVYRFRYRASDGNIVATSTSTYPSKWAAHWAIRHVKSGKITTEIYRDLAQEYRWRLSWHGGVVAAAPEGYASSQTCAQSLANVLERAKKSRVETLVAA